LSAAVALLDALGDNQGEEAMRALAAGAVVALYALV
jgi:hypothetical protein